MKAQMHKDLVRIVMEEISFTTAYKLEILKELEKYSEDKNKTTKKEESKNGRKRK